MRQKNRPCWQVDENSPTGSGTSLFAYHKKGKDEVLEQFKDEAAKSEQPETAPAEEKAQDESTETE